MHFITHTIQFNELNKSEMEPELHKWHYFINQYKINTTSAHDHVGIRDSEALLQREVLILLT
jgi:hypothetical protein